MVNCVEKFSGKRLVWSWLSNVLGLTAQDLFYLMHAYLAFSQISMETRKHSLSSYSPQTIVLLTCVSSRRRQDWCYTTEVQKINTSERKNRTTKINNGFSSYQVSIKLCLSSTNSQHSDSRCATNRTTSRERAFFADTDHLSLAPMRPSTYYPVHASNAMCISDKRTRVYTRGTVPRADSAYSLFRSCFTEGHGLVLSADFTPDKATDFSSA